MSLFSALLGVVVGVCLSTVSQYNSLGKLRQDLCHRQLDTTRPVYCRVVNVTGEEKNEADCNQDQCKCQYLATRLEENCRYNLSMVDIVRTCYGYNRTCISTEGAFSSVANCTVTYDRCEIASPGVTDRRSVGYPLPNPASCIPGLLPIRDTCNATYHMCKGEEYFTVFKPSKATNYQMSRQNCNTLCHNVTVSCLNYTKTCNTSEIVWQEGDETAEVDEKCNVIVKNCVVKRYIELQDVPGSNKEKGGGKVPQVETVASRLECNATTNATESVNTCVKQLTKQLRHKTECQLYGMKILKHVFESMFRGTDTIQDVVGYVHVQWTKIIKELCDLYCFLPLIREARSCFEDLPLQNILPGITFHQLEKVMLASKDLLCVSTKEAMHNNSCVEYLDEVNNTVTINVVKSIRQKACNEEYKEFQNKKQISKCSEECWQYLSDHVVIKHALPGCCLADIMEFREKVGPWMELMSPTLFKGNFMLNLMKSCGLENEPNSCSETDLMHPAVIFVIVVLSVISIVLFVGLAIFIIVFYRQMEYEGFKRGNLIIITG